MTSLARGLSPPPLPGGPGVTECGATTSDAAPPGTAAGGVVQHCRRVRGLPVTCSGRDSRVDGWSSFALHNELVIRTRAFMRARNLASREGTVPRSSAEKDAQWSTPQPMRAPARLCTTKARPARSDLSFSTRNDVQCCNAPTITQPRWHVVISHTAFLRLKRIFYHQLHTVIQ